MENSLRQQESDTPQQPGGFLAILYWLMSLVQLTEEEREDAGIYLDSPFRK
ncbi:MAG: hypothetical protein KGZ88_20060 [Methylomicrobium sp.]|nr:hypothetical protein [Methylomicrobium sp.]